MILGVFYFFIWSFEVVIVFFVVVVFGRVFFGGFGEVDDFVVGVMVNDVFEVDFFYVIFFCEMVSYVIWYDVGIFCFDLGKYINFGFL